MIEPRSRACRRRLNARFRDFMKELEASIQAAQNEAEEAFDDGRAIRRTGETHSSSTAHRLIDARIVLSTENPVRCSYLAGRRGGTRSAGLRNAVLW